jgi:TPR repeat protein
VNHNNLGLAYLRGEVLRRSSAKAIKWLRKAARQNYSLAYITLAEIYIWHRCATEIAGTAIRLAD